MRAPCFSYFDALTIHAFCAFPAKADFRRTLRTDSKGNPVINSKGEIDGFLPGLEPGSYYIIVRTNITLSIREDINSEAAMANNICPSDNPFTVTLPEIEIGTRKDDTLAKEGVKYYQITVPDTSGVSLRVELDRKYTKNSKSDAGTFNEMYIKYGSMPTLSNYDNTSTNPYSAKQEIIVPDTRPGIYYLMVKNNFHSADTQDITIEANLLGFELLYIDQTRGGNGGELTIKMTGTGLNYGVKPRLIKSGRGFVSDMEITNISNNDMIAPLYMLKAGQSEQWGPILTKLPGEDRYTAGYKKFLILAEEGPAGIIRPGAKGSVRIYSTTPPANQFIQFDIMKIQESGFEFDFNAELFWTGADKNDPNWIESIYRLEQEIGNSWEGYNKVLSNQQNTFYKTLIFTKHYLLKELIYRRLLIVEDLVDLSEKSYQFDINILDITDYKKGMLLSNPDDQKAEFYKNHFRVVIAGMLARGYLHSASFPNKYINGSFFTGFEGDVGPFTQIAIDAQNYDFDFERGLSYKYLNQEILFFIDKWIKIKFNAPEKCKNYSTNLVTDYNKSVIENPLGIFELQPHLKARIFYQGTENETAPTYDLSNEIPPPCFMIHSISLDWAALIPWSGGDLMWSFARMEKVESAILKINFSDPISLCEGKYVSVKYEGHIWYKFTDTYSFGEYHEKQGRLGEMGSWLEKNGYVNPIPLSFTIFQDFRGELKWKDGLIVVE